jgi:hypothetical protein
MMDDLQPKGTQDPGRLHRAAPAFRSFGFWILNLFGIWDLGFGISSLLRASVAMHVSVLILVVLMGCRRQEEPGATALQTITTPSGIEMVLIPGGSLDMGSDRGRRGPGAPGDDQSLLDGPLRGGAGGVP